MMLTAESLNQCASGDTNDFWELWGQLQDDLLLRCCFQWMGGNYADAEDALSEASLRALQAWVTKPPHLSNIKGWLFRLVQNHCRNIQKSRARHMRVVQCVEDVSDLSGEPKAEDSSISPEDMMLNDEMNGMIRRAISELPPRLQTTAALYFLQDVNCPDIATRLGLSPANVRKRLQHARELLRVRISAYAAAGERGIKRVRFY